MPASLIRPRSLQADVDSLRRGEVGLHEYVDELCDRIEQVDPQIRAYVDEPDRRARLRAEADALTKRWPQPAQRPSLFGAAVAVKDIMRVDGLPTRAGSEVPPELLNGDQAVIVSRLRAAGALVVGKTVTAEFAGSAPGRTLNPHDLSRSPGGSSSGSAAAVAAGLCTLSLGTQTIGSVIRPAAFCGIAGCKPTYGRITVEGVIAHSPSFDTLGIFAADVESMSVAAGVVWDDWTAVTAETSETADSGSTSSATLGVPSGRFLDQVDADALRSFDDDCARLRAAGHQVVEVDVLPGLEEVIRNNLVINRYEFARTHADWFDRHRSGYRDKTARSIEDGRAIAPAEYHASLRHLASFRLRLDELLESLGVSALVTPAATGAAPVGIETTGNPAMALPWTYAGLPAASLPAGQAKNGMPLGIQLVGRRGEDEALVALAAQVAAALA
ncbi:MAG: amidase [Nocardioidaceae bacterium]